MIRCAWEGFDDKSARRRGVAVLKTDDVGDSDAEERREQDGDDEEDDDEAHERGGALGEFGNVLNQLCLVGGVFLNCLLDRSEVVFEAADGSFLLAGVEGNGSLIALEVSDGYFKRFEVHLMHGVIEKQI